jgi:signal transduction histidine kinase
VPAFARHVSSLPVPVSVDGPPDDLPLTRTTETQLFRIGREALANVVKHANADTAAVRVEATNGLVVLEVVDDGCGFDPAGTREGHFGLESMRSRADEVGAAFHIISAPGRGTVVRVELAAEERRNGS